MKRLRNYFISGLLILLPVFVSVAVIEGIIRWIDGFFLSKVLSSAFRVRGVPGLGFVITITLIILTGALGSNILGKRIIIGAERILNKIPFFSMLYRTVKQIVSAFNVKEKSAFQKTVLVEFPRKDLWQLGFLTGRTAGEIGLKTGKAFLNIFVPTTPNPTTGFLLLVEEKDVIILDMPVEDAVKMIISAGIVNPAYPYISKNGKE